MHNYPKNRIYILFALVAILLSFSFALHKNFNLFGALAENNSDAIAVRVLPNPNHYSALRWFKEQGFSGSPQSIIVDGYEGIRDGRTVYVNAANIVDNTLYTNIYLISYNQDSERSTVDIFSQILDHWKFNIEITESGKCSISSIQCLTNDDCLNGYICDNSQNKCILPEELTTNCFTDTDCPSNLFCDNNKAKITRDVKRLSDFVEIREFLEEYKNKNNHYPILDSGSYIQNKTISAWPSWQETFGTELGTTLSVDPINVLGKCKPACCDSCGPDSAVCAHQNYDINTCWDSQDNWFADPTSNNNILNAPNNSNVFIYTVNSNGFSYEACAIMESSYASYASSDSCSNISGNAVIGFEHTGEAGNDSPIISCEDLSGYPGDEFIGHISAFDPDGDDLIWDFYSDNSPDDWQGWNWSGVPKMEDVGVAGQRKIYAEHAGNEGEYSVQITVGDGKGGIESKNCVIIINKGNPIIENILDQSVVIGKELSFSIIAHEPTQQYPLSFEFSGLPDPLDFVANGFSASNIEKNLFCFSSNEIEGNKYECIVKKIIENDYTNSPHFVTVTATDTNGDSGEAYFFLEIINNSPVFDSFTCVDSVRVRNDYLCEGIKASDPDGHNILFSSDLPSGITMNSQTPQTPQTGTISGQPDNAGDYSIEIIATDKYGAESSSIFNLKVKTYCGDGDRQIINDENGEEDCDEDDRVANSSKESSSEGWSYGCTDDCKWTGGYCGDGIVQAEHEECEKDESKANYELRTGKINLGEAEWQAFSMSCKNNCKLGCVGKTDIGVGCYIGNTCQKGKYICDDNDNVVCCDVFTPVFGHPIYDYCCKNDYGELSDGKINGRKFFIERAKTSDLESIAAEVYDHGGLKDISQSYYCDNVCAKTGKICVGVGLNNPAISNCVAVQHDVGNDCDNTANLAANDCRARFGKYSDTNCQDGGGTFYIGETACYCW